jgi:predicted esterase
MCRGNFFCEQESPNVDADVLKAVGAVHEMIDKEVAAGVSASNIFLCGFSQGGKFLMQIINLIVWLMKRISKKG